MLPAFSAGEICGLQLSHGSEVLASAKVRFISLDFLDAQLEFWEERDPGCLAFGTGPHKKRQDKSGSQQDSQNAERHVVNVNPACARSE